MGIVFAYSENEGAKVKVIGKTINILSLLIAISKYLAERISKERGVLLEEAEDLVADCIKDGMKTIRK